MINYNNFDTKRLIKYYRDNNISPIYNTTEILSYLNNLSNPTKVTDFLNWILKTNVNSYLLWIMWYSFESFKKWLMYYFFADLNNEIFEKSYSLKFLNLYYSHLFLSYWILQFNWISLDIKSNKVQINYFDVKNNKVESFLSSISCKWWIINHKHFWPVFYDLISDYKNKYFISNIDSIIWWSWYFTENNFLDSKNESTCRNFYTYNYSSKFDFDNSNIKYIENINIRNNENCTNIVQQKDYSTLINTVQYELIYLIWMYKSISNDLDFINEILKFFPKDIKNKYDITIFEKVEEFEENIKYELI